MALQLSLDLLKRPPKKDVTFGAKYFMLINQYPIFARY
jgi:hypothetical protein